MAKKKTGSQSILLLSMLVTALVLAVYLAGNKTAFQNYAKAPLDQKVFICHIPPGNPEKSILVSVSKSAWERGHDPHNKHNMDFLIADGNTCPPTETASPVPTVVPTAIPGPTFSPPGR